MVPSRCKGLVSAIPLPCGTSSLSARDSVVSQARRVIRHNRLRKVQKWAKARLPPWEAWKQFRWLEVAWGLETWALNWSWCLTVLDLTDCTWSARWASLVTTFFYPSKPWGSEGLTTKTQTLPGPGICKMSKSPPWFSSINSLVLSVLTAIDKCIMLSWKKSHLPGLSCLSQ